MPALFAIADTHFGHKRILAYTHRPFLTIEAMDAALIEAWNRTVKDDDWVFHLGDFGLAPRAVLRETVSCLKGRKLLMVGNHDRPTSSWWERAGFVRVYRHPVAYGPWVFSHRPLALLPPGCINVHGHLHEGVHREAPPADPGALRCCVSVEQIGYAPMRIAELPSTFQIDELVPWHFP